MKKLQLKVRDLTNPTFLTHYETKNIMGGSGYSEGSTSTTSWIMICTADPGYMMQNPGTVDNASYSECTALADKFCKATTGCASCGCAAN